MNVNEEEQEFVATLSISIIVPATDEESARARAEEILDSLPIFSGLIVRQEVDGVEPY